MLRGQRGTVAQVVLEQLDMHGEEVVPVLRREFAALRLPGVPDAATHESLRAGRDAGEPAVRS
jgi:hypothetical protein